MHVKEIDVSQLRVAARAAREANDKDLVTDALQDRQPSEAPVPLDAPLEIRKLEVQLRYILAAPCARIAITNDPIARKQISMWCEGEVVSVKTDTRDKNTDKARTLLPAGAIRFKWPADVHGEKKELHIIAHMDNSASTEVE
eukprot:6211822-Pleurochrysis_carterae.AAC.6